MSSPAIRVLLASPDRRLLRRLARFLDTFGYETSAVADLSQIEPHLIFDPPDILILDENFEKDDSWSLCRAIRRGLVAHEMQNLLLWEEKSAADLTAPLEAGVDDFLVKPVDYGELLARLRFSVRQLEFERRLCEQSGEDPQTRLLNADRFWEKLRPFCLPDAPPSLCVLFAVDAFSAYILRYGTHAGETISRLWAEWLSAAAPAGAMLGSLDGGRFGAVLPNSSETAATAWQETLRRKAAAEELNFGGRNWHPTVSCILRSLPDKGASHEQLREQLLEALQTASRSGGDCFLLSSDLQEDLHSWTDLAAPGKLFERTTARSIMSPCTVVLREEDPVEKAATWLQRTGLPALPVIDAAGKLRGIITASQVSAAASELEADAAVKQVMCTDAPAFADDARMETLRNFFALNASRFAMVTRDDRPVGWITPDTLMALIRPIHRESFKAKTPFTRRTTHLRVPDLTVS
jgi:GGDEF domain-containing protein/predicted transcriptional regulator